MKCCDPTDLLLQRALQRVHFHLLLPQTGLVGNLLLLGLGPHLSYFCIGPRNTQGTFLDVRRKSKSRVWKQSRKYIIVCRCKNKFTCWCHQLPKGQQKHLLLGGCGSNGEAGCPVTGGSDLQTLAAFVALFLRVTPASLACCCCPQFELPNMLYLSSFSSA